MAIFHLRKKHYKYGVFINIMYLGNDIFPLYENKLVAFKLVNVSMPTMASIVFTQIVPKFIVH